MSFTFVGCFIFFIFSLFLYFMFIIELYGIGTAINNELCETREMYFGE